MVLSATDAARVVALIEDGRNQRYVARFLQIPRTTIQRVVKRHRETGLYSRRPGSGRKRSTSAIDDRFIVLKTLRDRHTTSVETRTRLQEVRQVNVSLRTVRRRLNEHGLIAWRPLKGPEHRVARLHFARNNVNWT